MRQLLHIKTSVNGNNGESAQLAERYITQWKQKYPQGEVVERDLIAQPLAHMDGAVVGAFFTPAELRSEEQQVIAEQSEALIAELKTADEVVIGLPLYNFGVPSQLKTYFDYLARAGLTFKYTETGPVGLIEDKPVRLLATRGGMLKDAGLDYQVPFTKQFLAFIGLNSVDVVYAEGLSMGDIKDSALATARGEVDALLSV